MKVYFAIKFHADAKNKALITMVLNALEKTGFKTTCLFRDLEDWGRISFDAKTLMEKAFAAIKESDLFVCDATEKGVGTGIEASYAHSNKIPVIVIAQKGTVLPETLKGIATKFYYYENEKDLLKSFDEVKKLF